MLSDLAGMRLTESPASSPSPTPFTVHLKPITLDPGFVLGVVGVVATILAAFWAVWVSKRSVRREAEPIYRLTWTTLLELPTKSLYPPVDDPELRITYGGESVKVVRRGYLAYWNAGDDPIDPKTGLEDKPPRLVIPKAVVLAPPKILACSDDHIDFKARVDPLSPNSIELIFPFLKREQGALVEFLFTGDADFHKLEGRNKQAKDARFDGELRLYKRTTYWDRVLNNLIETMPGLQPILLAFCAMLVFGVVLMPIGYFALFGFGWFGILILAVFYLLVSIARERPKRSRSRRVPEEILYWPYQPSPIATLAVAWKSTPTFAFLRRVIRLRRPEGHQGGSAQE